MIGNLGNSPGLEWFKLYAAVVVDNDDPMRLCRVKARIQTIMDDIPDEHLPWAVPFTDYSVGEHADYGVVKIPPKEAKVMMAFQDGSIHHPVYMGYLVDEKTQLFEMLHNYPDRNVLMWPNKCMVIVDTKSNEIMFRSMGDMHVYVTGNVDLTVKGNLTERVTGDRHLHVGGNNIEHIKGTDLKVVEGDDTTILTGNSSTFVSKDYTHTVEGESQRTVAKDNTEAYAKDSKRIVGGNDWLHAGGRQTRTGSPISDNPGSGGPSMIDALVAPEIPPKPKVKEWEGVRWEQPKDENE